MLDSLCGATEAKNTNLFINIIFLSNSANLARQFKTEFVILNRKSFHMKNIRY